MKNGSIVREKSFKNSRSTAGIASVMATIPHIKFKSIFGLGEDCIRKDQCTTVDVFLTSSSLFLRRYQKAVQESNRKKIYRRRNHADIECRCKCDSTGAPSEANPDTPDHISESGKNQENFKNALANSSKPCYFTGNGLRTPDSTAAVVPSNGTTPDFFMQAFYLGLRGCLRTGETVDSCSNPASLLFCRRTAEKKYLKNVRLINRRRNHANIECRCDSTRKQTRSGTIPCPSHLVVFFLHRPAQDQDKSFRGDHSRRTSHRRQRSSLPLHRLASGRSEAPSGNQSHTHAGLQHDQAVIRKYGRKTSAPVYYV